MPFRHWRKRRVCPTESGPSLSPNHNGPVRAPRFSVCCLSISVTEPATPSRPDGVKLLVLDLDNTLVHVARTCFAGATRVLCGEEEVWVRERPFVAEFMRAMMNVYEVVVFTLLESRFARPIIAFLERGRGKFTRTLCREDATAEGNSLVKDISRLGHSLASIVLLDNSPDPATRLKFPKNLLPLSSWENMDPKDRQLRDVIQVLKALVPLIDVSLALSPIIQAQSHCAFVASFSSAFSFSSSMASISADPASSVPVNRIRLVIRHEPERNLDGSGSLKGDNKDCHG